MRDGDNHAYQDKAGCESGKAAKREPAFLFVGCRQGFGLFEFADSCVGNEAVVNTVECFEKPIRAYLFFRLSYNNSLLLQLFCELFTHTRKHGFDFTFAKSGDSAYLGNRVAVPIAKYEYVTVFLGYAF